MVGWLQDGDKNNKARSGLAWSGLASGSPKGGKDLMCNIKTGVRRGFRLGADGC